MGSFETVYASTMPDTAMDKAFAHHRYFGIPIHRALPRVFVAISAKLSNVLKLTDGKVRQQLRISQSRMVGEDWRKEQDRGRESLTQAIGRAAYENGLKAILVRSAASSTGEGLVIFPANLKPNSKLKILNASGLPS
jgi:RES domain-containing protein